MAHETQLWHWFVFQSDLPTARAKALLLRWSKEERTLEEVLSARPQDVSRFGLKPQERRALQPPETLPDVNAIRWNEARYPRGLHRLPLKLRPALLFVKGSSALLEQPIVTVPPAPVAEEERELMREALSLLLGESLLPAAVQGSDQASLVLTEMAHTEGDVLLFVRAGLENVELDEKTRAMLDQERLLLASPLPPTTAPNPRWASVLIEVEAAAANRCVLTTSQPNVPQFLSNHPDLPTLWLHTSTGRAQVPSHVEHATDAAGLLLWLTEASAEKTPQDAQPPTSALDAARPLGAEPPSDPPPTPEETLRILQKGGDIPPALRKRLLGDTTTEA
jgi:hypothetical protein